MPDVYGPSYGDATAGQCFLLEFTASFLFIFIIHSGAADENQAKRFRPYWSPFFVGLFLHNKKKLGLACFICIVSSSKLIPGAGGACFNPGRALGPAIATGDLEKQWIYIMAPAVAAVVHSSVYRMAPFKE